MNIKRKLKILLPTDVVAVYCTQRNLLTLINTKNKEAKTMKPEFKIVCQKKAGQKIEMFLTNVPTSKLSNAGLKLVPSRQTTTISVIKNLVLELKVMFYQRLKFVGVGYRVLLTPESSTNMVIKLGYSHLIFYNLPPNVHIYSKRYNEFTIFGKSDYRTISQTSAKIRGFRKPEPYKGKGVLYEGEKIPLKQGKRV